MTQQLTEELQKKMYEPEPIPVSEEEQTQIDQSGDTGEFPLNLEAPDPNWTPPEVQPSVPAQPDLTSLVGDYSQSANAFVQSLNPEQMQQYIMQNMPNLKVGEDGRIINEGISGLQDNIATNLLGQNADTRYNQQLQNTARSIYLDQQIERQKSIPSEVIRAALGAREDQIHSLGSFADLSGDTLKLWMNNIMGRTTDPSQKPWLDDGSKNPDYEKGSWTGFLPKNIVRENHTGWGNFARDILEFRLMLKLTNKFPGRVPNQAVAGDKKINFITKAMRITRDGAVADLLTEDSELGNIMNSAQTHMPWLVPQITAMMAVDSDDNPWEARIKTVAAGSTMNWVGYFLGGLFRGARAAKKARQAGKSVDEANDIGNNAYRKSVAQDVLKAEEAAESSAKQRWSEGKGISKADTRDEFLRKHLSPEDYSRLKDTATDGAERNRLNQLADQTGEAADDIWDWTEYTSKQQALKNAGREPDPFVNPEGFDSVEKATYGSERRLATSSALRDAMDGGTGRGFGPIASEAQIRSIAIGNKALREIVTEVLDDISNSLFHSKELGKAIPKGMSQEQFEVAAYRIAAPLLEQLDIFLDGGKIDLGKMFRQQLKKPKDFRLYGEVDGTIVKNVGPVQRSANTIVLRSLAQVASDLSSSALTISDQMPIGRQAEMVFDAMKVLFLENKKLGMMWGLDGQALQKGFVLSDVMKASKEADLTRFNQQTEELFGELDKLRRSGDFEGIRDLLELFKLSDGKVRTQAHILEFLSAKLTGGRMDGIDIRGMTRTQLQGTFFNSILSGMRTAPKAIIGTNMIAYLRPAMGALGSVIKMDRKELAVAMSTLDSLNRSATESWAMWKYNWDLGVNRQTQVYQGKFDIGSDLKEWNILGKHIAKYGSETEKMAYGALDFSVKFNSSPWVKYSANAMGAGDAYARTVIGRQYMAIRAARDALAKGVDPKDLKKFVRETEENFRNEIFTKNKDGMWIVSDKAAAMAGDEAAMTTALEGSLKGFELIANWPGMRAFFPFVRTGFNYLDITFQHTPAGLLRNKYRDLAAKGGPRNLEKYGIRPEDVAGEIAIMEGRIAAGTMATIALTTAALSGRITGDLPWDNEDRKLWKAMGIQPNSFVFDKPGGGKVYVSYKGIEIFNTLFAAGANTVYGTHLLGEKGTDEWQRKLAWMFSNVIVEQSMLGGLGDLMDIFNTSLSDDLRMKAVARIARSHVPFKGLANDFGMILDANQKEANTLWETLLATNVGTKSVLYPKYDILSKGKKPKPLTTDPLNPLLRFYNRISPVPIVPVDDDPVREALMEIRFNLPDALARLEGVELDSRQRSELQKYLASSDLYERLLALTKNPDWQETLKDYKVDKLKDSDGWDRKATFFYREVYRIFQEEKEWARSQMALDPRNRKLMNDIEIQKEQKRALATGDRELIKDVQHLKKHGY